MAEDGIEAKADKVQSDLETKIGNMGKGRYGRILQMAHTPDKDEYLKTARIAALGIIALGAIGFFIMWLMTYMPDYF